ncbi:MAG: hypothetical protein ACOYD3_02410 [Kiritimatiellia bacterium]|jgi:hypothetical protein
MDLCDPKEQIPWITYPALEWLDCHIHADMTVFEWGTGGSTLFYARHTKHVVSVEHNPEWYDAVLLALNHDKITNCEYLLVPPKPCMLAPFLPYSSRTYVSRTFAEHARLQFRNYVRKISEYPDRFFDLVVVDGRARAACLRHAVPKVRSGGYVMLDNSERPSYRPAMDILGRFPRLDFPGHGPRLEEEWMTTVWQISRDPASTSRT